LLPLKNFSTKVLKQAEKNKDPLKIQQVFAKKIYALI